MNILVYAETAAGRDLLRNAATIVTGGAGSVTVYTQVLDEMRQLDEEPPPDLVLVAEDVEVGELAPSERVFFDHLLLAARRRKIPAVLLGYWQQTGQSYGAPVVADLGAAHRVQTLQRLVAQARTSLLGLGVAA
jgi:hypothetical protein